MKAEFAVPAVLMSLMFIGVLIRKIPVIRRSLIPASILGGLLGSVLINTGVLNLDTAIFERITFHLFTLSFISITYMGIHAPREANKGVFKGGLWLAVIFGLMISVQAFIGSSVFLVYNNLTDSSSLIPALGGMIAHGFAQGPGQAVAIGTIWEGVGVKNAIQYGLFYAATGYLFAFLLGIPFAKFLIKKKRIVQYEITAEDQKDLEAGLIKSGKKTILGYQTAHHANLDTLSLHVSLIGFTYLLAYLFAELVTRFLLKGAANESLIFGNMFVWGILFSFLIKKIIIKLKFDYIVDTDVQGSISGFLVDFLVMASLLAINIRIISAGLVPVLITILIVGISSFFIVLYFANRSGAHPYERFMTEYGIITGTAATGLVLLRLIDPQFKSPVVKELVWWNILNLFFGALVFLSQMAMPVTNFRVWYGIMFISIFVFLILLKVFKLWGKKGESF